MYEKYKEFAVLLEPIQSAHQAAVFAAEARYAQCIREPLPSLNLPNTSYWARHGPTLDSYRAKWREQDAAKQLQAELAMIDQEFADKTANLEREFFGVDA